MKQLTTILALLFLGFIAAAFPHGGPRPVPVEAGVGGLVVRDDAVIDVTVYVDGNGKTLSVETHGPTATATANVDTPATGLPPIVAVPDVAEPHGLVPTLATDVDANVNAKAKADANDKHQQPARLFGISYSPYSADGTCRTDAQVEADIAKLSHYAFVRIYGVDCDQTRKVVAAARRHNLRVFAGVYDLQNLHGSLKMIIDAAAPDLGILHTISIGNELLNRGQNSAQDVVNAVNDARGYLRSLGYRGPVVTVDTFSKLFEHPELCGVSDYCAANCHAFFDNTQNAENAGKYVRAISRELSRVSGGKRTVITESGWPHAGQPNGRAVPSPENHRKAIQALRRNFNGDHQNLILFSAFDDLWKVDNEWTFGAEKFWGIERR
ncbi:glycoside hydrolase family 17 protein [Aspergillus egyptiacus]|nr:glycoside hydrolase family 17 protein [Aspergillus egyptiacus]